MPWFDIDGVMLDGVPHGFTRRSVEDPFIGARGEREVASCPAEGVGQAGDSLNVALLHREGESQSSALGPM